MESAPQLPRIAVFALGGTIASTPRSDHGDGAVSPQLSGADLIDAVPGLRDAARLEVIEFRSVPSCDLELSDVIELARRIEDRFADGASGAVVTQGTDTMEETAFALDLLTRGPRPVVITGAMRGPTAAGADGPANLLAAVRVAASDAAAGLGALVVMNDEIHAARWVKKMHSSSVAAFRSPEVGPIGSVVEGRARFAVRPPRHDSLEGFGDKVHPVALVKLSLGDDDRLLREVARLGYRGLVVEGFGAGHAPARVVSALEGLAAEMPVVLVTRTGSGSVLSSTYGFAGSESDLLRRGLISGGSLDGPKARVLLSLLIGASDDVLAIRAAFERRGGSVH
jgi:L-asparaginase